MIRHVLIHALYLQCILPLAVKSASAQSHNHNYPTNTPPIPPNRTIVLKAHGALLQPMGLIGLESNNMLLSIFNKARIPSLTPPVNCDPKWIQEFNTNIFQQTNEYVNMFTDIAAPSTNQANKRSLIALGLGLGLADILLTGLSYGALNSHVNRVEDKLDRFINTEHEFHTNTIKIEEGIVQFVNKVQSNLNKALKEMQCQIFTSTGKLFARQLTDEWSLKIETLLKPIIEGGITTKLTPDIIAPNDLRQIIAAHDALQNTYFARNIFNFYKVATITVTHAYLEPSQGVLVVHQILTFPDVKPQLLLPYYRVAQNSIIKHDQCFTLKLPEYVYEKQDAFYPLDSKNCLIKALATCYLPPLKDSMFDKCLSNVTACTLHQVGCQSRFTYDTSGILITTKEKILAFNFKKSIQTINTGILGTTFLSWDNVKLVQIGETSSIERPKAITTYSSPNFKAETLEIWDAIVASASFNVSKVSPESILREINITRHSVPKGRTH